MPIATGLALGLGAMSLAGGIGSAAIGANAAGNAANAQVNAANYAADLQKQEADKSLAFQQQIWNTQQQNIAPWLQSGGTALGQLMQLMGMPSYQGGGSTTGPGSPTISGTSRFSPGGPGQSLGPQAANGVSPGQWGNNMAPTPGGNGFQITQGGNPMQALSSLNPSARTSPGPGGPMPMNGSTTPGSQFVPFGPWTGTFTPPTDVTEKNDPGYKFRLDQGTQALDRSAAAKGTLLSGAGIKPYERFAQDYASNEYGNVYNRELNEYELGYNQFENNQTNQWNRLAALSGLGQTSAAQLNSTGTGVAGNYAQTLSTLGSQLGQDANNAGAARGSGYVGAGNAWGAGIGGGINNMMQLMMLQQLYGGGTPNPANAWNQPSYG